MPAVSVTTNSTEIVPANYARTVVYVRNASAGTINCHIAFGAVATTAEWFLSPGESFVESAERVGKAAINGISSSGTITLTYTVVNQGT